MSNQSYASGGDPYWLSSRGVNAVSFNKLSAPPLAYVNKGVLYELNDGILYFNGTAISSAKAIVDDITFNRMAINPGGADTEWMDLSGQLHHGARNTESNDTTILYVSANGTTTAAGANGFINSPISTIVDALSLYQNSGTTIQLVGNFTGETVDLPAQCVLQGNSGLSFRSLIGPININSSIPSWLLPAPYGILQSYIANCSCNGAITFDATGITMPLFVINNSILQAPSTFTDDTADAILLAQSSIIATTVDVTDMNAFLIECTFGLASFASGSLNITHTDIAHDMTAFISNCNVGSGTVTILANSTTNVCHVTLSGTQNGFAVNIASVAVPGGLVLTIDDISLPITWGVGAQANTTIVYIKNAATTGYSPAMPSYWNIPPTEVKSALDELASRPKPTAATGVGGLTTIDYDSPQSVAIDVTPTLIALTPASTSLTADWTTPTLGRLTYAGSDTPKAMISLDLSFLITVGTGDRLIVYLQKNGNPIAASELNVAANVRTSTAITTVDIGIVNGDYFDFAVANRTEACTLYIYTSDLSIMSV